MKKKDNHNTVDVKVGELQKAWIVKTYGTDVITLSKKSLFWMIIKQNLELRPRDYMPVADRTEYVSFVLLRDSSSTRAYCDPDKDHPNRTSYRVNTLFRCCLSPKGERIISRMIQNQFRNAFHCYMKGALNNNPDLSIVEAVTEFISDSLCYEVNNRTVAAMVKHWYRYRKANNDEFSIPIFF